MSNLREKAIAALEAHNAKEAAARARVSAELEKETANLIADLTATLREKLGDFFDALGIVVPNNKHGIFAVDGVAFEVGIENAGIFEASKVVFWRKLPRDGNFKHYWVNVDAALVWLGQQVLMAEQWQQREHEQAEAVREQHAISERLAEVVEAAAACDPEWVWTAGYELTYYRVSWRDDNGYEAGFTLQDQPVDGWVSIFEQTREIELRFAAGHYPVWQRFTATSVTDLPSVMTERAYVNVFGVVKTPVRFDLDDVAVWGFAAEEGAQLRVELNTRMPVEAIRMVIDDEIRTAADDTDFVSTGCPEPSEEVAAVEAMKSEDDDEGATERRYLRSVGS
ncbi:MAG: hypothetical protein L6Q98_23525 [Anaerolineae bacterium]|nr:hypothetical protein [Anaerolineae bacterium]NUQ06375.1 hypothetical protein [Anaerolineae bacterium]